MLPLHFQDQTIAFTFWAEAFAADELLVTAFAVDEAIFGMTRIEVMLSADTSHIDLEKLMDAAATLTVHHKYLAERRHFSGIVVEAECGDSGHHRTAYRVVLMPSLYRLDHGSDCRIFQQKTVPDIIRTVLSEHGVQDIKWILEQNHLQREYAVAYRETHLAFLERIMAEEGIFYYFEHDKNGKHQLVISDTPQVLHDCPGQKELEYNNLSIRAVDEVYCSSLNFRKKLRSTTFVQADYSFKNPNYSQLHASQAAKLAGEKKNYELYNYPGRYKSDKAGAPFTRYKLEAARVDASIAHGVSNTPLLLSGHGVTLTRHINKELNCKWRLLTIRHEGVQPQAWQEDGQGVPVTGISAIASSLNSAELGGLSFDISGSHSPNVLHKMLGRGLQIATRQQVQEDFDAAARACVYANAFTAQPSTLAYRAPQMAKPVIDGPQIAIVVGPPDEEIYTDEHGRVKVHFPWDRHNPTTAENSSCWIRVSQAWGGGMYGNMAIPRIGHEVIVDFLEGDPDQPIIIGRTYHANNKSPYQLPDNKTRMVIRSDTHKGDGFNELSFEDENGQENMFIHAQKDQTIKVLNNRAKRVEANEVQSIGANRSMEVGLNAQEKISGSLNRFIGGGGGSLLGILGAITAAGAKDTEIGSEAIDNPLLKEFATTSAVMSVAGEAASLPMNSAFNAAAGHFIKAGLDMAGKGHALGGLLSQIMPVSGIANTVIEKFQSDTIGIARTEQIGTYKNTSVGHTMTLNVGEQFNTRSGKEYNLYVGEKAHTETKVWELYSDDKILLSAPGGYIEINKAGIILHAKDIKLQGNAIAFEQGGPGEGPSCLRQMAQSSTPFVR